MNALPVLKSKVSVPQLPEGVLISDRIKGLGIKQNRVVAVVAPAGYGKTTAILASVRHSTNLHWYRLEKEDARLPIFYAHLLDSLFSRVKKQEPESVKFLRSISDARQGYELLNAVICQDVWALYGDKTHKRRYIVFDDFQHVQGNEQIIDTMRYFISNMPKNLHIIIASRKETGIFDGVPGLKGDICFLSEKELSFREEEIALYMKELRGLILPPGTAVKVCRVTEGWISGVVLICNMMQRLGIYNIEACFQDDGKKNEIFRFFLTEALQGLSPGCIRSIALIATLDEFSITDIETAFVIKDAEATIRYCEELNLFIQKTVSGETTYRFHPLFRNFLLGLQNEFFSPEEIEALRIRASDYYLKTHDNVRAIRHMLQASRLEEVVRLLCLNGRKMLDTGLGEYLKMFIEELPGQLVENNPYLSFFYGFTIISSEFELSCTYLKNAMRLFELQGDTDMQVQVMAVLFTAFAQRNDVLMIRKLVTDCEKLDKKIKNRDVRGTLLACRLGRAVFDEDFDKGLALYEEIRQYKLNDFWLYGVNNFNCMIHYRLGNLVKSRTIIEKNMEYVQNLSNTILKTLAVLDQAPEQAAHAVTKGIEIFIPLKGLIDVDKEIARQQKELLLIEKDLARVRGKLGNSGFLEQAPADVVEKEKGKEKDLSGKHAAVRERLSMLTGR
jgi:ATP/maltotriose-dependent transcriptional regulator MalT